MVGNHSIITLLSRVRDQMIHKTFIVSHLKKMPSCACYSWRVTGHGSTEELSQINRGAVANYVADLYQGAY